MKYAFLSHESAVEANRAIARRSDFEALDDEGIWMIPAAESCVTTQADLKELMKATRLDELGCRLRPIHLLTPGVEHRSHGRLMRSHVWSGLFPERAFVRLHERVFVSSPLFTSLQFVLAPKPSRLSRTAAEEASEEDARIRKDLGITGRAASADELLAWEGISREARAVELITEFCGTYRMPVLPEEEVLYGKPPLLSRSDLGDFLKAEPAMHGAKKGLTTCRLAFDRSGSPMETAIALLLTLPIEMGGYGLPKPVLNWSVPVGEEWPDIVSQDEIIADLCWRDARLVIEYDGWEGHGGIGPAKLAKDRDRANSLTALGWHVLSIGYEQVRSERGMALLARQAARLLGIEPKQATDLQRVWRTRLHAQLMPTDRHCA